MKTSAIPALVVLALLVSCGGDEAQPTESSSAVTPAVAEKVSAKPELVPAGQRRILELEGGVRVEVLAEGRGEIVAAGDEVALSMTLTYIPPPPAPVAVETTEATKPAKGAPTDKKKSSTPKGTKPRAQDTATEKAVAVPHSDDAVVATEVAESSEAIVAVEAVGSADADPIIEVTEIVVAPTTEPVTPSVPSTSDAPADMSSPSDTDPNPVEAPTAAAPAPLAAPLEPVVVVSTKESGSPIRARVGASSSLVPGLSRALVGLRQGTIAQITIPAEAAYGAGGLPSAGIPPGTPLLATIEIREVRR